MCFSYRYIVFARHLYNIILIRYDSNYPYLQVLEDLFTHGQEFTLHLGRSRRCGGICRGKLYVTYTMRLDD